jgi:carbon monoxide dehydrogenase subunit G
MRLNESIVVSARPQLVWDFITEPSNALNYFAGITRWEVEGDKRTGLGARYRMLMRVGAAEMGGLVEIVEFNEPLDMAWSSLTGVDQRGRWRLRKAGGGRTRVEFRFAYGVAGAGITGYISERVAAPGVRRHLRRTLQQLKREVEREQLREDGARRKAEREAATA